MRIQEYKEFQRMLVFRCLNYVYKAKWMGILLVSMAMCHLFVAMTAEGYTVLKLIRSLGLRLFWQDLAESQPQRLGDLVEGLAFVEQLWPSSCLLRMVSFTVAWHSLLPQLRSVWRAKQSVEIHFKPSRSARQFKNYYLDPTPGQLMWPTKLWMRKIFSIIIKLQSTWCSL